MSEKWIAVVTVHDPGAAEVAREALSEAGVEVEVKLLSPTAYMAIVSPADYEVRVAPEQLKLAEGVLENLAEEAEEAAEREWATAAQRR